MPRESQLKKSKIQPSPRSPLPPIQKQTETPKIGLLDTIKQGFAWGIGTSMSRIIVDKIFSSDANLPNANLPNANLPNANLPNANLPNANFPNANLPNANLPKNDNVLDSVSEDLYKKYQDCLENNKKNCNLILEKANI